jgi:leader peptidase (prepilin peptidase)/N-methyltransferase
MTSTVAPRSGAVGALAWQIPLAALLAVVAVSGAGFGPRTVGMLYVAAVTPELARVDILEQRLPNRLVLPGLPLGFAALAADWAVTGALDVAVMVAAVVTFGLFVVLGSAGGVGMGDVKLAALLGLVALDLPAAISSPVIAFLLGGMVSIAILVTRGRGNRFPFGPFLLLGYWITVAWEACA